MNEILIAIAAKEGLQLINSKTVAGGDINSSFLIKTSGESFFVKLNAAGAPEDFFIREKEGLQALSLASTLKIPNVIGQGEIDGVQYLLLEWLEKKPPGIQFFQKFAEGLTNLHRHTNSTFGWHSNNFIGSLVQTNHCCHTWAEFYTLQRLMPLTKQLFDSHAINRSHIKLAEMLGSRLHSIFPNEPPALLHGDLWSGNYMPVAAKPTGEVVAAIFDPAVYFGHREMDIGMSLLFGGFDNSFYEHYHTFYPLEKGWKQRVSVTQLYPLLVHAILFGGNYITRCKNILEEWK